MMASGLKTLEPWTGKLGILTWTLPVLESPSRIDTGRNSDGRVGLGRQYHLGFFNAAPQTHMACPPDGIPPQSP